MRNIGIQTTSRGSSKFIPSDEISDIIIHEGFKGFEVRFYMAIVVKNQTELEVVFPNLLPRKRVLEVVWRGTRELLDRESLI